MCELWDEPQKELLERETKKWDQARSLVQKTNAGVMEPPSSHCTLPNCALGLVGTVALFRVTRRFRGGKVVEMESY